MAPALLGFVSGVWFLEVGAVALGLVGALYYLRRLRGGSTGPGRTVMLTGQHALHVVELDGRRMVIGTGPSGAPRFVCDLEAGDERGT